MSRPRAEGIEIAIMDIDIGTMSATKQSACVIERSAAIAWTETRRRPRSESCLKGRNGPTGHRRCLVSSARAVGASESA
jgi:hypothetical protein